MRIRLVAAVAALAAAAAPAAPAAPPNWTWIWGVNGVMGWNVAPTQVQGLAPVSALSAGSNHVLALRQDGTVWAWGNNQNGQLGDGTTAARSAPVQVLETGSKPLASVTAVAAGWNFSLALKSDGTVWGWGRNANGELSDGSTLDRSLAGLVTDSNGAAFGPVRAIAAGWGYAVAARTDQTIWEWGRPLWQQVGSTSSADRVNPKQLQRLRIMIDLDTEKPRLMLTPVEGCQVTAGKWHAAVLTCGGSVFTWGLDDVGQLGPQFDPEQQCQVNASVTATCMREPQANAVLTGIAAVAAGDDYTVALDTSGSVWTWGANVFGQLGDGTTTGRVTPQSVSGLSSITAIAAGEEHALARRSDGSVFAWGLGVHGQLGFSPTSLCTTANTPCATTPGTAPVPAGLAADALAAGGETSLLAGAPFVTLLPSPGPLDFGNQPTMVESAKTPVTIWNRTSSALTVTGVSTGSPRFLHYGSCTSIAAGQSCQLDLTFKPYVGGYAYGQLTIQHSSGTSTLALKGYGWGPAPSLSPDPLAFGSRKLYSTTTLTATLTNGAGAGTLDVGAMLGWADFSVSGTTCGATLAGGASCTIFVAYTPTSTGAASGWLEVKTPNGPAASIKLPLTGEGGWPSASLSTSLLDFSNTDIGKSWSQTVTLTNSGTAVLKITSVWRWGSAQFSHTTCPATVPVGGSCTVTVTFAPVTAGSATGGIRFENDGGGPHDVQLKGVGVPVGVPSVVPNILSFGSLAAHAKSSLLSATLGNVGGAALTVQAVRIVRPHDRDFILVGNGCAGVTIAPGGTTCTADVVFRPRATGPRKAELVFWTNNGTATVQLNGTGTQTPVASSWPQFGRAAARGAWNADETALDTATVQNLVATWSAHTGGAVRSSPAVADGVVYWGSDDGAVYAADAVAGKPLWTTRIGTPVRSSPAVAKGAVYVGADDGSVYALEAATGNVLWATPTGAPVASSPALADGLVFVATGTAELLALEATTGKTVWNAALPAPSSSSPAVAGGVVYVGCDNGAVRAFEAAAGKLLWTRYAAGAVHSAPAASGGLVYVGSSGGWMYALESATGAVRWSVSVGAAVESSPAVADGVVYFGADDGVVRGLDAGTGVPVWIASAGVAVAASPAVANGVLYAADVDGVVHAFDAYGETELWTHTLGGRGYSSPAVVDGVVYVGADDGDLYAFAP